MQAFAKTCPRCGAKYDAAAAFCQRDGAALRLIEEDRDPRIGQVLLDQFRIEERIGAGGMGMVYRARQTTIGRDVAIKILHADLAQNPDAVRRFHREARISTSLDHPNIVRVFLFGQLPDGSLYLVMELLRGRPLADLLRVEPRLSVSRALHIAIQVAEGVGEAHAQGIVHRDVKPENVFLVTKGRDPDFAKVLDFGIARLLRNEDQTQATQSGLVFGTARYISPEGAAGEPTDARSDVYSMGVLTYQMLSGETPFDAPSPVKLLMQHIHDAPPPLDVQAGALGVPRAVASVVMRALAKNPEARFDDAAQYAEALREAAERGGVDLRGRRGEREPSGRVSIPARGPSAEPSPPSSSAHRGGPERTSTDELVIAGLSRRARSRGGSPLGTAILLATAFALGVLAVGGLYWALARPGTPSAEEVHAARVSAAEQALIVDRLDGEGETVLSWTDQLLAGRPDDPDALRLRRAAFGRLAHRARVASEAGEREQAAALYRRALVFVPDDAEATQRLEELSRPAEPAVVTLVVAPSPVAGAPVTFSAEAPEALRAALADHPQFVVLRAGRVVRRLDATPGASEHQWVASYAFTTAGAHTVQLRAGAGEGTVHAELEVDVARAPRPPGGGDPPVTTQGSLGPSTPSTPSVVGAGTMTASRDPAPALPEPFVATPVAAPPAPRAPAAVTAPIPPSTLLPIAPAEPALPPAWTSGSP